MTSRQVSLVVPIYNEGELIEQLHAEVTAAMELAATPWKVLYVNDGSRDRSLEILLTLQARDARVTVIELSRNWGHQSAISAGLSVADGDAVVLMDGDLQDPPAVVPDLITAWKNGAEVVIATRRSRADRGLRGRLFPLFYQVLGKLSDYPISLNTGIFGLMDRRVVDSLKALPETNRYLPGLRSWVGFRTAEVFYDRAARAAGEPKQTLVKLIKYGMDAIFSFSHKPLRLALFVGLTVAALGLLYGIVLIACLVMDVGMFGKPVVAGYTSTIVSILFLGGVQLICVGILGEYIGRVYDEVKRRPLFLIRKIHRGGDLD